MLSDSIIIDLNLRKIGRSIKFRNVLDQTVENVYSKINIRWPISVEALLRLDVDKKITERL